MIEKRGINFWMWGLGFLKIAIVNFTSQLLFDLKNVIKEGRGLQENFYWKGFQSLIGDLEIFKKGEGLDKKGVEKNRSWVVVTLNIYLYIYIYLFSSKPL